MALLAGCTGQANYPENSLTIRCTNVVDDCAQQISEVCPQGYKLLYRENWSTQLAPMMRGGGRSPPVRHTKMRIICDPASEPTEQ